MNGIIKLIKNIKFWLICGIIVFVLLLIAAGYLFEWSLEIRIFSIIILLSSFIILFLYMSLHAVRKAQKLEQESRKRTKFGLSIERQKELGQFKEKILSAIQSIRKSQLSMNIGDKSNLYSLPWYIFIGTDNAGQTSLIASSDLNFPFGIETGKTENCDWFFSNSSVFIDVSSKLTINNENERARDEWYILLDTLKKYRWKKPVDGVILSLSISYIINRNDEDYNEVENYIKNRIRELILYSGYHLPVYLIFTKCDEIEGFDVFFKESGADYINQVWGYTFSGQNTLSGETIKEFEHQFDQLSIRLKELCLGKLAISRSLDIQQKLYNFPQKFYALRENIVNFVSKVFKPNFYDENPIFRGFYFTSSIPTQKTGKKASEEIEMQFDPERHVTNLSELKQPAKKYFIKELFSKIIIPDKNISIPTKRMLLRLNIKNISPALLLIITIFIIIINVLNNVNRNRDDISKLKTLMNKIEKVTWNEKFEYSQLKLLKSLIDHNQHLQDKPILGGTIYQGQRLSGQVDQIFIKNFTPFFLKYIFQDFLEKEIHNYIQKSSSKSRDQVYELLRGYLLLDSFKDKLEEEKSEKEFLKNLMIALVDTLFKERYNSGYQKGFNEKNLNNASNIVQEEIIYYIEAISRSKTDKWSSVIKNDKSLIENARNAIGKPNISDVYARIKREGLVKFKQLSIAEILSENEFDIYDKNTSISEFFTKTGWNKYVQDEIEKSCKNPGENDWVLNIKASELPDDLKDAATIKQGLKDKYFLDYSKAWWEFLRNISYQNFENPETAAERLIGLGDFIDSPLRILLKIVSNQTKFEGELEEKVKKIRSGLGINVKNRSIDEEFKFIHALSEDEGGKLADILSEYDNLAAIIESLEEDSGEKAAKYASNIIKNKSGEIPDALQSIRRNLRRFDQNAREAIFDKPVLMAWNVVMDKTQVWLDNLWNQQVYMTYKRRIADNYPLNKSAEMEIPLNDMEEFFRKTDGIFWTYVNTYLEPFLKTNSWNTDSWEGRGIKLSENMKKTFIKSVQISEGLGLDIQNQINLEFKLLPDLPEGRTGSIEQIILSIDGKEIIYRMGKPLWINFRWPNPDNISSASIEVRTRDQSYRPYLFDSRWSWFRLLDKAQIQGANSSLFNIIWRFPDDENYDLQIKFKLSANSINNPFSNRDFFTLSVPASLSN